MENSKTIGYKFNKTTTINKNNSRNPLAKLTYKELQKLAKGYNLPTQLKHKVLLALVIAREQNREDIVNVIVKAYWHRNKRTSAKSRNPSREPQHLNSTATSRDMSHLNSAQFGCNMSDLNNAYDFDGMIWTTVNAHQGENLEVPSGSPAKTSARNLKDADLSIFPAISKDVTCSNVEEGSAVNNPSLLLTTPNVSFENSFNAETRPSNSYYQSINGDLLSEIKNTPRTKDEVKMYHNLQVPKSQLSLEAPTVSFDSGNGSFCSFLYEQDAFSNGGNIAAQDEVNDADGLGISITEILESLSRN